MFLPSKNDDNSLEVQLISKTPPKTKTQQNTIHLQPQNRPSPNKRQFILIKNIKYRKISVIIGCILIHLAIGSYYTFGNMLPYIASYVSSTNSSTNKYEYYSNSCTFIFSFALGAQGICTPFGGRLEQLLGPQLSVLIGGTIFSTSVAITFFTCTNVYLLYLTYGFLFGIGMGIAYPSCLVCAMKWFPDKKGYINGIVLAGFGSSALIFDRVQTSFINPTNISIDSDMGFIGDEQLLARVPYCFLLLGGIFFVMIIIGTLLINDPPSDYHLNGNEQNIEIQMDGNIVIADIKQVLKNGNFWHLFLCFFIDGLVVVFIATQWKEYSNSYLKITDDLMLSIIGAIAALFNGFGRIFWGFILDKTQSFRVTLGIVNISLVVLLFVWPLLRSISATNVLEFFDLVFVGLLFGLFSGNFVIFATAVTWTFGTKNNGINMGLLFMSQVLSSFIGVYSLDLFLDHVGWQYVSWFIGGIQIVGFVVAITFPVQY